MASNSFIGHFCDYPFVGLTCKPFYNRAMINRATGEVGFRSGLHVAPHCLVTELVALPGIGPKIRTQFLPLNGWKRLVFGSHDSEHGTFEVEALSSDGDRIQIVLLAHEHGFYEPNTPEDAERRAFHDGVIHSDLAGQQEFSWGEVLHRLEIKPNKDWLVIAYSHDASIPLPDREVLLRLRAHENIPDDNF